MTNSDPAILTPRFFVLVNSFRLGSVRSARDNNACRLSS